MFDQDFKPLDLTEFVLHSEFIGLKKEELQEFRNSKFLSALEVWKSNPEQAYEYAREFSSVTPESKLVEIMLLVDNMREISPKVLLTKIVVLESTVTIKPELEILRIAKASALFQMFRYTQAIEESEKVLKIFPQLVELNLLIAQAYAIQEEHKKAIPFYKKVINSQVFGKTAIANMAYSYLILNRTLKSLIWHKKIVDAFPENYKIQYNMALCYSKFRLFRKAIKFLNRAEMLEKN